MYNKELGQMKQFNSLSIDAQIVYLLSLSDFPQTIENVDYETIESFISNFNQVYEKRSIASELSNYLAISYPEASDKQVDISSIKNFITGKIA